MNITTSDKHLNLFHLQVLAALLAFILILRWSGCLCLLKSIGFKSQLSLKPHIKNQTPQNLIMRGGIILESRLNYAKHKIEAIKTRWDDTFFYLKTYNLYFLLFIHFTHFTCVIFHFDLRLIEL